MKSILEKLRQRTKRCTTEANYFGIWRNFNSFVIKLDRKPKLWEDRICLYMAYLINKGLQSATIKSYYSAIKCVLREDNYLVDDNKVLLTSLSKACRIKNDKVQTRLPIRKNLLEMLLFEVERRFGGNQPYLETLYKTLFLLAYYGLFRIGELTLSPHVVKAANVHIGQNKDKMLFVLYSSKTHGRESRPQKIKISAEQPRNNTYFCPFSVTRRYLALRGRYMDENEPFFIFRDRQPVKPSQIRFELKTALLSLNLKPTNYSFHGFCAGRCTDMVIFGKTIEQAKAAGRWRSSAIYKYIKN